MQVQTLSTNSIGTQYIKGDFFECNSPPKKKLVQRVSYHCNPSTPETEADILLLSLGLAWATY